MHKHKVVFFGTPEIGATILESLVNNPDVEVQLVITQPDKKEGRKQVLTPSAVKKMALKHGLPLAQPQKLNEIEMELKNLDSDFFITCAYGKFLPSKILAIPKVEALNLHGSLLPAYRGGSPIQTALWNGETETGMSLMRMVKEMDAGPYFAQSKFLIPLEMNNGELFEKMALIGAELLNQNLALIKNGQLQAIAQDPELVTFAPIITPGQEKINWHQNALVIHNQIRALSPNPGAYTTYEENRYKILKTKPLNLNDSQTSQIPGTIIDLNKKGILVATKNGILEILTIQKAGKNPTPAGVFGLNSFKIGGRFI